MDSISSDSLAQCMSNTSTTGLVEQNDVLKLTECNPGENENASAIHLDNQVIHLQQLDYGNPLVDSVLTDCNADEDNNPSDAHTDNQDPYLHQVDHGTIEFDGIITDCKADEDCRPSEDIHPSEDINPSEDSNPSEVHLDNQVPYLQQVANRSTEINKVLFDDLQLPSSSDLDDDAHGKTTPCADSEMIALPTPDTDQESSALRLESPAVTEDPSSNLLGSLPYSDAVPNNPDHPDDSESCLLPAVIPDKQLDDVLSELKFGFFQIKMIILTGGGYFAVCSEILVFVFLSTPVKKEWDLTEFKFPWLPFFSGVGGIIGGYIFGILSDKCGRQVPFMVAMGICAASGLASAFAPSFLSLVAIRSFVSVGIGGLEAVDFVLLLEFLPKRNRGTVMVVVTLFGALGAVYAGGAAWLLLPRSGWGWRWFVGVCAIPCILVFIFRLFVSHETPRYLFISGQPEKAMAVLKIIAKDNGVKLTEGNIICPPVKKRGSMFELFSPELRWRTVFICLVWLFQSTGYWGVTLYLPEYMDSLGVDPYLNMFTIFLGEIPGLCLAMILIERHMLGRIKSLRFFSFFTGVSLLAFSFVTIDFLKAVFVVVCYFFMVPIYAILNAFTPEIYPTSVRSTAMALANVVIEVPGLVTPFAGEVLLSIKSATWLYPFVWASCFGLQFLCTFGLRKETAGQNLVDRRVNNNQSTSTQS